MPSWLKTTFSLFSETFAVWLEDDAPSLGAALAYYTIFSLAPLLVIVIGVAGMVWRQSDSVRADVMQQVGDLVGPDGAEMVGTMLDSASGPGAESFWATLIGGAVLLFGATTAFAQLKASLNVIWGVRPDPDRGFVNLLLARVLSFGLVLTIGFLLLVSLILSAALSALDAFLTDLAFGTDVLIQAAGFVISLGVVVVLFALIFKYLPDAEIEWRDVWVGAFITALLFTLGKFALGVYLGSSSAASAYGAAGSLVLLLIWIYYSAQILFFGAAFTRVYAQRYGAQIRPAKGALRAEDLEDEGEPADEHEEKKAEVAAPAERRAAAPRQRRPLWKRAAPLVLAFFVGRALGRRGSS